MKIANFKLYNKGKLRAFFDLELDLQNDQLVTIKGFKIMEGINGVFVSLPSQQKDGEWYDTVFCSKNARQEMNRIAIDFYNQESGVDQDLKSKTYDDHQFKVNTDLQNKDLDEEIPF